MRWIFGACRFDVADIYWNDPRGQLEREARDRAEQEAKAAEFKARIEAHTAAGHKADWTSCSCMRDVAGNYYNALRAMR